MRTIELFSGTKSFSKVMEKHGHATFTVDNDAGLVPDLIGDVSVLNALVLPEPIDILWASPPCTCFSVASIGHHWKGGYRAYEPKTADAEESVALIEHLIEIIEDTEPVWWFIENPRGVLRKLPVMELLPDGAIRKSVTYCQYGDTRMKPTDIWTNAHWWNPRPMCKNGDKCHEAAPRGSRTGTQGLKGAKERGVIPPALFEEILSQMP